MRNTKIITKPEKKETENDKMAKSLKWRDAEEG